MTYLLRHLQVFFYVLGQLARTPLATLMSVAVIGITLALPSGLYVLLDNLQRASRGLDTGAQVSLFLKRDVGDAAARRLADKVGALAGVADVAYISREAALEEFTRLSGFGEALKMLDDNPLPPVLVVQPAAGHRTPAELATLVTTLGGLPGVELAQLDLEWIKRLNAILEIARRGLMILASLLGLAVLLIIGNTIRLAIISRRTEIEVIKLIGGTDAFIRRPFLYSGLLQGLAGAVFAWLLVLASRLLLSGPAAELASLYGSRFDVAGLGPAPSLLLFASGGLLGWLGSRVAVGRHLREIEPA